MNNKDIASQFNLLAKIMELHGENPFKIRSYSNAYLTIRKLDKSLSSLDLDSIGQIQGIGKAISAKIEELLVTGKMTTLERFKEQTPQGIQEMLNIKGFGPKKIMLVWKELGIETAGELLYACKENRLVDLKGFGEKTQTQLIKQLEYFLDSSGKYLYANVIHEAEELLAEIRSKTSEAHVVLVGELARRLPIVGQIEFLLNNLDWKSNTLSLISGMDQVDNQWYYKGIPVKIETCKPEEFGDYQVRLSSSTDFYDAISSISVLANSSDEQIYFNERKLSIILPELREDPSIIELAKLNQLPTLISNEDIKGVVHNHSTYSDGLHSLEMMANHCKSLGYSYFVISDHSKSAFYANGLREERLYAQWAEIDELNKSFDNKFKIFKSIESDILSDGRLDYHDDILEKFDLVIASIHSNLRMDESTATKRLITAIKNPFTRILGHPTGRLLLARQGYPINHKAVIEACAEYQVDIELNSNPYRLDLDWTWIPYAIEKGVLISINPDAHSKSGIEDIRYGVSVARKAGLTKENCLNSKNLVEFEQWIRSKTPAN